MISSPRYVAVLGVAVLGVAVLGPFTLCCTPTRAADSVAAGVLPETTVLYAELSAPADLLDLAMNHPIREQIEQLDGIRKAMEQQQYLEFKVVVSVIEAQLGATWPKLIARAAGGGIAVGFDAKTNGAAVIVRGRDEDVHDEMLATLVKLARQDAADKGKPDPVKSGDYRGVTAYQLDNAKVVSIGGRLLLTNNQELGKLVIDNHLDGGGATLGEVEQFKAARKKAADGAAGWAYVDIESVRKAGVAKDLFKGQAENPLAELLVGGILTNLQKTPYATASLYATPEQIRLALAAPHDPGWVPEEREYFFGVDGTGTAPPLLAAKESVLSISAFRDVSEMWLRAGDLFDDRMNDSLAEADSNLSTLFGGKDFGEDILGAVKPEVQLVVTKQDFADGEPQPAIKLPAFAVAFELKEPEQSRADLRRTFQSLIGFLNIVGAMNGQPQLDMDIDKEGDLQVVSGTYLAGQGDDLNQLAINFNFSPAVAFVNDSFIVSSTKRLARELAGMTGSAVENVRKVNTAATADFGVLRSILDDNRSQLVAQNMLEDGNSKEEAENEIDTLLLLLGFLRDAQLQLDSDGDQMQLELSVGLQDVQE